MKKIKYYFPLLLLFLFSACEPENPYLTEEEFNEYLYSNMNENLKVAFIGNNDVYILDDFDKDVMRITNSPMNIKTDLKISKKGDRILYLDGDGTPRIINFEGKLLETLHQFRHVKVIEWANDDKSFFIVTEDNEIDIYGESIDLPTIEAPDNGAGCNIVDASISENFDVAIIYEKDAFYTWEDVPSQVHYFSNNPENEWYEISEDYSYFDVIFNSKGSELIVKKYLDFQEKPSSGREVKPYNTNGTLVNFLSKSFAYAGHDVVGVCVHDYDYEGVGYVTDELTFMVLSNPSDYQVFGKDIFEHKVNVTSLDLWVK